MTVTRLSYSISVAVIALVPSIALAADAAVWADRAAQAAAQISEPKARENALRTPAGLYAGLDRPEPARKIADAIGPDERRRFEALLLLNRFAADPSGTAAAVHALPPGKERELVLGTLSSRQLQKDDLRGAQKSAAAMPAGYARDLRYESIARALCRKQRFGEAETLIASIADEMPKKNAQARLILAKLLAKNTSMKELAAAAAAQGLDPSHFEHTLDDFVDDAIEAKQIDRAEAIARAGSDPNPLGHNLLRVARARFLAADGGACASLIEETRGLSARCEPAYAELMKSDIRSTQIECGQAQAVVDELRNDPARKKQFESMKMRDGELINALVYAGRAREAIELLKPPLDGLDELLVSSVAGMMAKKGAEKELEAWWTSAPDPVYKSTIAQGAAMAKIQ